MTSQLRSISSPYSQYPSHFCGYDKIRARVDFCTVSQMVSTPHGAYVVKNLRKDELDT